MFLSHLGPAFQIVFVDLLSYKCKICPSAESRKNNGIPLKWFNSLDTNSISLSSLLLKNCAALEVKVFLVFCFSELKSGVDKFEGLPVMLPFLNYFEFYKKLHHIVVFFYLCLKHSIMVRKSNCHVVELAEHMRAKCYLKGDKIMFFFILTSYSVVLKFARKISYLWIAIVSCKFCKEGFIQM